MLFAELKFSLFILFLNCFKNAQTITPTATITTTKTTSETTSLISCIKSCFLFNKKFNLLMVIIILAYCSSVPCLNGKCVNQQCKCYDGYMGDSCDIGK